MHDKSQKNYWIRFAGMPVGVKKIAEKNLHTIEMILGDSENMPLRTTT
jgi:hypothetical protein